MPGAPTQHRSRITTHRLGDARGIGIVDSIVALSLFLLATATIGQYVIRQVRMGSTNAMFGVAYALAAQELEKLRGLDYDAIASRSSTSQEGVMTYAVNTTVIPDSPEPNMKDVTVDIGWHEPDGLQHVQVRTIYTAIQR